MGFRITGRRQCYVRCLLVMLLLAQPAMAGCSAAETGSFLQGLNRGLAAQSSNGAGFPTSPELLVFGGAGHRTFLGCLNCSKYDSDSILNPYGTHGSKYHSESILNRYSPYGSNYSMYGACNPYATDPPVVVDRQGTYYGRLSVNTSGQFRSATIVAWLTGVCAGS